MMQSTEISLVNHMQRTKIIVMRTITQTTQFVNYGVGGVYTYTL